MPELPEVEIVRQSLNKKIKQKVVKKVLIRNRNLRFKIPLNFFSFYSIDELFQTYQDVKDNNFCLISK